MISRLLDVLPLLFKLVHAQADVTVALGKVGKLRTQPLAHAVFIAPVKANLKGQHVCFGGIVQPADKVFGHLLLERSGPGFSQPGNHAGFGFSGFGITGENNQPVAGCFAFAVQDGALSDFDGFIKIACKRL